MIRRLSRLALTLVTTGWLAALQLHAQVTQPPNDFKPMSAEELAKAERIPAANLVYGAYAFVWVALLVYVFVLWQRIRRAEQDVADLNARLATGSRR